MFIVEAKYWKLLRKPLTAHWTFMSWLTEEPALPYTFTPSDPMSLFSRQRSLMLYSYRGPHTHGVWSTGAWCSHDCFGEDVIAFTAILELEYGNGLTHLSTMVAQ